MGSERDHPRAIWLPRLPKKLRRSMADEDAPLPMGWGIHIIEGINKALVSKIFWLTVLAVFVVSTFWTIWKQKGVSMGPLALSILALVGSFLTSKFYEQIDV